jgi:hypothetical protein
MPSPAPDCGSAPDRAWKIIFAILVVAFAAGICWFVEKRSAAPPPPPVTLPYDPPQQPAAK